MLLRQMLEVYDLLDKPDANGDEVAGFLHSRGADDVTVKVVGEGRRPPIASRSSSPVHAVKAKVATRRHSVSSAV